LGVIEKLEFLLSLMITCSNIIKTAKVVNGNILWSVKKTGHYIISDNFVQCEPIFTAFALLRRKLNF